MNFTDNITYVVRRKHNLTFGFRYRKLQQNSLNYANARGSFSFSGLLDERIGYAGPAGGRAPDTISPIFCWAIRNRVPCVSAARIIISAAGPRLVRAGRLAAIWRGLTINFGLRYEYFAPYTELHGHLANLDVSPGFTAVAVVTPGEAGPYSGNVPTSLVRSMPKQLFAADRSRLPALAEEKPDHPHRLQHLLQRLALCFDRKQMAQQPPFAKTASISTSLPIR